MLNGTRFHATRPASSSSGQTNSLLRFVLGAWNVFVGEVQYTFAQAADGDWSSASLTTTPSSGVVALNPPGDITFISKRTWDIHGKLIVIGFNGQSNSADATSNFAQQEDPEPLHTVLPPMPGKFLCCVGGIAPTQTGTTSEGVADLIDAAQIATLVDAKENINTGRTVGSEVTRQTWASSFCQAIAAAIPDDNVVVGINFSHGSTSFADDVQHAIGVDSATWLADVVTFVFDEDSLLAADDQFEIRNSNPGGYDGTYAALTVSADRLTVTAALTPDPGAYVSGASAFVASAPMVNMRRVVRRCVNVFAPALGLDPYFLAICYNGNESSDLLANISNYTESQLPTVRTLVDEMVAITGQAEDAWIVWPQVNYPVADWHQIYPSWLGGASPVALGALEASLDDANFLITCPQYSSKAGGTGDSNPGGCIHFGTLGKIENGERPANLLLDAVTGDADHRPVRLLTGEGSLVRVANSTTITGTFSRSVVTDATTAVTDPGNYGFEAFSGVTRGGNDLDETVDSVTVNGTAFTMVLDALPAFSWGNRVGYAYHNGDVISPANNIRIQGQTWAAGVATYTTVSAHGLSEGDEIRVSSNLPAGYDVISPAGILLAGTTGSTLKLAIASDPGVIAITGATWSGGVATYTHAAATLNTDYTGYVTVTGMTPSGYNVTGAAIVEVIDSTHFSVAIAVNPGAFSAGGSFTGGGSISNNGVFCVGRTQGPRGIVRGATIDHRRTDTGEDLPRWMAMQLAEVDVYASIKGIAAALVELGMDSLLELVLDFGNSTCWDTSDDFVTNLGTSGATNNYYLGLGTGVDARDPTFTGTPGALDRTNYFLSNGGGKEFTAVTTPDILTTAHQAGGEYTIIVGLVAPGTLSANNYQIATCQGEGGSQGPGVTLRISSDRKMTTQVEGDSGATVMSRTSTTAFASAGGYGLIGCGIKDGDNTSWIFSSTGATTAGGFEEFTPVFDTPSSNAAQSVAQIWKNGDGTIRAQDGLQIMFLLVSNTKINREVILPLMRTLDRRQRSNLPA